MRNTVGVIDSGFRGEVALPAVEHDRRGRSRSSAGDRVCQIVIMPYERCEVVERAELSDSERGADGYGSTGVR